MMSRTTVEPGKGLESALSGLDWTAATDQERARIKSGIQEILVGMDCHCNGECLATDSVGTTIRQRIRAIAITRRVDIGMKEIAASRGVDVAVASQAEIAIASTAEEINSLIAIESIISQETIEAVVTNDEMGVIQTEEMGKTRKIRDPDWGRDLSQFVTRATPHPIYGTTDSGLAYTQTAHIDLLTLCAEVDDNGEVCCWVYEEPSADGG